MINRKIEGSKREIRKTKNYDFPGSALKCEVLGSHHFHLYNKKKLNQLKLNDLSWTPSEKCVCRKTGSINP